MPFTSPKGLDVRVTNRLLAVGCNRSDDPRHKTSGGEFMGSFSAWHWLIVLLLAALVLLPGALYILTLQRAMEAVDPELRPMAPGLVWLLVIPLFNMIWLFFVVVHLKTGYERMQANGRLVAPTSAGFGVGIAMGVTWALCLIPFLNLLVAIPSLVLWILHWVQVSGARKLVKGGEIAPAAPIHALA
jgi:hypothetical protein